jgi:hypothetical protein
MYIETYRFSSLFEHKFLKYSNNLLGFVSVCGYVPFFITDFIILCLLLPLFCHVGQGFVNLVNLFKDPTFCLIDFLYSFFGFDLIDLRPNLYYFSLSAGLGLGLLFFFQKLKVHD